MIITIVLGAAICVGIGVLLGLTWRKHDKLAMNGGGVVSPDFAFVPIPNWLMHENLRYRVQRQNVRAMWLHWAASIVGGGNRG